MGSHWTNINTITTTEATTNKEAGKMARSGVPVTIRHFLNDDPFFKNTWEDFDKLTEGMFSEPKNTWKRFDQDFRNHTSTSMQKSSQQTFSREERKESTKENSSMTRHNINSRQGNGWLTPEYWMLPGMNSKLPKSLDSLKTDEDENKMEVKIDTSQYRPDELKVTVEGKHEEKAEDGSNMVSRMFSKKYTLPADARDEDVVSKLSSDGVLVVTAPKNNLAIK